MSSKRFQSVGDRSKYVPRIEFYELTIGEKPQSNVFYTNFFCWYSFITFAALPLFVTDFQPQIWFSHYAQPFLFSILDKFAKLENLPFSQSINAQNWIISRFFHEQQASKFFSFHQTVSTLCITKRHIESRFPLYVNGHGHIYTRIHTQSLQQWLSIHHNSVMRALHALPLYLSISLFPTVGSMLSLMLLSLGSFWLWANALICVWRAQKQRHGDVEGTTIRCGLYSDRDEKCS